MRNDELNKYKTAQSMVTTHIYIKVQKGWLVEATLTTEEANMYKTHIRTSNKEGDKTHNLYIWEGKKLSTRCLGGVKNLFFVFVVKERKTNTKQ